MNSSTAGGFDLCPSDACQSKSAQCPVAGTGKFNLNKEITSKDPLVQKLIAYCKKYSIDVAGIEFVENDKGERFVYDVNLCSNYNSKVEKEL